MRYLLSMIIVLFLSHNAQAQAYAVVGFYNLENLFDTVNDTTKNDDDFTPDGKNANTEEVFRKKLQNLADVISIMGTDRNADGPAILGVAEIENRYVLEELTKQKKLKSRNYKIVHFESPDKRGIDVAMLYNPRYFRVLAAEAMNVSLMECCESDYPTRDVLYVYGKLLGEKTHVFVNHWPSRRGGEALSSPKREAASQVCKNKIDSIRKINPNAKIIVMGDLNDDPINKSVTKVLNSTGKLKKMNNTKMYNPWLSYFKKGIGTIAWKDAWGLFDQILVSDAYTNKKDKGLKYHFSEVMNRNFLIQKSGQYKGYPMRSFTWGKWNDGYSDHFPTLIYLR